MRRGKPQRVAVPCIQAYNTCMTHGDDHTEWQDPGGPEPPRWDRSDDADVESWTWDQESLMMAEYVGHKLYLELRDRMCTLDVPVAVHNMLIRTMIDMHDEGAMTVGAARVTMVIHTDPHGVFQDVDILAADEHDSIE